MTKYSLDQNFLVDVIYKEDLLPEDNTLIDVAYSYNWRKVNICSWQREMSKVLTLICCNFPDEPDAILLQDLSEDQSLDPETQEEEHKDQPEKSSGQEKEDRCGSQSAEVSP